MLHVKFDSNQIVKQISGFVRDYEIIDIDAAVREALDEVADLLLEQMRSGALRHKVKGRAYDAIERTEVQRVGNYFYVEVGALRIRAEHQDGFHIVYQEYGSPKFGPPDPWLRPALEQKALIRQTILEVFRRYGVPNVQAA